MFSRLRDDISCVFERDPAARSTIKQEISRLNNAESEKQFFSSLPPPLKSSPELIEWLKQRKAARETAAKAELNELF